MGKPRNDGQKGGKPLAAKAIKEGQVKKNKAPPAFKQTPKGKVALINGKKNGNVNTQKKPFEKPPQQPKAPANAANKKKGNNNPQVNSPTKPSPQKKKKNNKKAVKPVAKEESDSDEDINEGISIDEQISVVGEDDDDSSDEDATPNILGASLAEDSDDDDEDFEADSEEETENKGVKMFKGIQSTGDDDDDDDDDEEDEDDDDEDEDDVSANVTASSMNTSGDSSLAMESTDDDDEDDEDEDEDEDEDADDESPGLKALLGQSLVDDEDDEDFNDDDEDDDDDDEIEDSEEDEDDDESQSDKNMSNASATSNEGKKRLSAEAKAEQDSRTIYIGNVPKEMKENRLKKEFAKFGPIESIRVRGVVPDSPQLSYKVAKIKQRIHEKVACICVFIIFKSEQSAKAALVMNGKQLDGNYLRVDMANSTQEYDPKKTVFVGNLAFALQDNDLWELFGKCGKIEYVRTVRDRHTGVTRGIGYVCFKSPDAVALALDLNGTELHKRQIRVERYVKPTEQKPKKEIGGKKRPMQGNGKSPSPKKIKNDGGKATVHNAERRVNQKQKRSQGEKQRTPNANGNNANKGSFQGQKADAKKGGKKFNKFEKKKKAMAGKLTAKPKKPVA